MSATIHCPKCSFTFRFLFEIAEGQTVRKANGNGRVVAIQEEKERRKEKRRYLREQKEKERKAEQNIRNKTNENKGETKQNTARQGKTS